MKIPNCCIFDRLVPFKWCFRNKLHYFVHTLLYPPLPDTPARNLYMKLEILPSDLMHVYARSCTNARIRAA